MPNRSQWEAVRRQLAAIQSDAKRTADLAALAQLGENIGVDEIAAALERIGNKVECAKSALDGAS